MKNWCILGLALLLLTPTLSAQSRPYRSNKTVKGYRITPLYVKATSPEDSLQQASSPASGEVDHEKAVPILEQASSPIGFGSPSATWMEVQQQLQHIQTQLEALTSQEKSLSLSEETVPDNLTREAVVENEDSMGREKEMIVEKEVIQTGRRDTILVQNQVFLNTGGASQDSMFRQLYLRQEQLQNRWEAWMERQMQQSTSETEPEASPQRITIRTTTEDPQPTVLPVLASETVESLLQQQQALADSLRLWRKEIASSQPQGATVYPPLAMVPQITLNGADSTQLDSLPFIGKQDTTFYYSDPVALYQLSVLQSDIAELKSLINQQPVPPVVPGPQVVDSSQSAAMAQLSGMMEQLKASQQASSADQQATIAALRKQLAKQDSLAQLPVEQPKGWTGLRMARVFFDKGQSTLQAQDRLELEEMALLLREQTDLKVEIRGFADKSGNPALNQRLSQQRANSVQTYLQSLGIAADRMAVVFFGDEKASYGGELDRRVEVVLVE